MIAILTGVWWLGTVPTIDFVHHDSPNDHGEISLQRTSSAKLLKHGGIIGDDLEEHLRTQIVNLLRAHSHTMRVGNVLNDVNEQSVVLVDKFLPRIWIVSQTTL